MPATLFIRSIIIWITACLTLVTNAQEPATIWDREILAQPFDKEAFRQIAIPEWVQDTLGCGYTLSVMDHEHREQAASAWSPFE